MTRFFRRAITHPLLAVGSTLLWGLVELLALQRSRRQDRRDAGRARAGARAAG